MTQLQTPSAVVIAPLLVVTPCELQALQPREWFEIACALVAEADGRPDLSHALVRRLEAFLGVNDAHRRALVDGPETVIEAIRETREAKALREQRRAAYLNRGQGDHHLSEEVGRLLKQASEHRMKAAELEASDNAAVKAGRPRKHRKEIKEHLGSARSYEIQAGDLSTRERDFRWLVGAIDETKQLALARGEEVDEDIVEVEFTVLDDDGAPLRYARGPNRGDKITRSERFNRVTIGSRGGGIEYAYEKGHLEGRGPKSQHLKSVGERYRDCYEIIRGLTTTKGEGGGGGGFHAKAPQMRHLRAGEDLKHMREDLTPRELAVLDLVCGQDMRLRPAAKALGAGFPSTKRALHSGLVKAWASLKGHAEARKAGFEARAGDNIEAATRLLRKAER